MIVLTVEDKCQNCPDFSPTVDKIDCTTIGGDRNISQTVYCSKKSLCKGIEEYLKKKYDVETG